MFLSERVDPKFTSQECSVCHHIDPANREGEKFLCTQCGHIEDANLQAARNIKQKAINVFGLNIVKKKVGRDLPEPKQLTLFQTPTLLKEYIKEGCKYNFSNNPIIYDVHGNNKAPSYETFKNVEIAIEVLDYLLSSQGKSVLREISAFVAYWLVCWYNEDKKFKKSLELNEDFQEYGIAAPSTVAAVLINIFTLNIDWSEQFKKAQEGYYINWKVG